MKMAHLIKAFPTLRGEAARKFQEEAHRVDTAYTKEEKEETLARLRRAFRFIRSDNTVRPNIPAE